MAKYKIVTNEEKEIVDRSTGELTTVTVRKVIDVKVGQEEKFYSTFVNHVSSIYELTSANAIKILLKFCEIAGYETGEIQLSTARRKLLLKELSMSAGNFTNSVKMLREKGLIDGVDGEYVLNPLIFWKGSRSKRLELLKSKGLSVTFNFRIADANEEIDESN